jgi:hypothetical protein
MAWDYVSQSGPVETAVTGGDLTLTEPEGAAEGNLLVACIAYRNGAAFTLPADWGLVATQQSSGDTDATNGIASGVMAYIVRGSSAPSYVFTRTNGNVALGRVLCYRGNHATPYDTGTANTLAVASGTVTTGTFTTAEAGELIVAMGAGGDNYTWSAFDAATDPATASGATDTTTEPTAGTWIERADSGTGTGADTSLAIADAIRAGAGATGTIQVTASGSARSVMIAGAFKISATDPTTIWVVASAKPASVAATTSKTLTIPASVEADDYLLVRTCNRAEDDPGTLADDEGAGSWTNIADQDAGAPGNHSLWFKRASANTASKTLTHSSAVTDCSMTLVAFRNVTTNDPAYENLQITSASTEARAGFTTSVDNTRPVFTMGNWVAANVVSAVSTTSPGGLPIHEQHLSADATSVIASELKSIAGATGDFTWAQTNDDPLVCIVLALLPITATAYTLTLDAASYAFTGQTVSLELGREIIAGAASYAFTPQAVTLSKDIPLAIGAASYSFGTQDVALELGREIIPGVASYSFAAQDVSLEFGREIIPDAASYSFTGQDVSLELGREIIAGVASYNFTAQDVTLNKGLTIAVDAVGYTFTTQDITLTYVPVVAEASGAGGGFGARSLRRGTVGKLTDEEWEKARKAFAKARRKRKELEAKAETPRPAKQAQRLAAQVSAARQRENTAFDHMAALDFTAANAFAANAAAFYANQQEEEIMIMLLAA